MKISNRTHPVLEILADKEIPRSLTLRDGDPKNYYVARACAAVLNKVWPSFRKKVYGSVNILTDPFCEALVKAEGKLSNSDIVGQIKEQSGVVVIKNISILFSLRRVFVDGKHGSKVDFIEFLNDSIISIHFFDENYSFVCDHYIEIAGYGGQTEYIKSVIATIQIVLLFKQFAEIETKDLSPGQKIKDINCKYINETKIPVTILDSKWFTTLVKSDGFKVRGHFRLQPKKKDGKWTKELIWIADFEKTGYTAPARKLSNV